MNPHLPIVVNAFYGAAAALALPSIPGFLYFGWAALRMRWLTPAPPAGAAANTDSMIGLIETGARVFGSVFRIIGAAGEWLTTVLAAAFFLGLLLAGGLFFTGRGIQAHAGWARAIASLVVFALLLTSLVAMLAVRRSVAPAFAFIAAACVYATWVLLRRFA